MFAELIFLALALLFVVSANAPIKRYLSKPYGGLSWSVAILLAVAEILIGVGTVMLYRSLDFFDVSLTVLFFIATGVAVGMHYAVARCQQKLSAGAFAVKLAIPCCTIAACVAFLTFALVFLYGYQPR